MNFALSILVAVLFSVGIFLILQKDLMRLIIGVLIISNAANVVIFTAGGFKFQAAPLIGPHDDFLPLEVADPLPQALILTAIVIGLGVIAYLLILAKVLYRESKSENVSEMRSAEK